MPPIVQNMYKTMWIFLNNRNIRGFTKSTISRIWDVEYAHAEYVLYEC